ncbi:DUF3152 domain-containing protein [Streptomyces sp. UNOC14_S4]|uniref:DUF3152 domain-containing protein n=1 Tax=Streptomyces sp. UNOC14_S4 TaxID=2872340 RepID=UPI001E5D9FE4|nr:DUF3152 domain-containing protein [Streptomyces sp. UNOC14_S4]
MGKHSARASHTPHRPPAADPGRGTGRRRATPADGAEAAEEPAPEGGYGSPSYGTGEQPASAGWSGPQAQGIGWGVIGVQRGQGVGTDPAYAVVGSPSYPSGAPAEHQPLHQSSQQQPGYAPPAAHGPGGGTPAAAAPHARVPAPRPEVRAVPSRRRAAPARSGPGVARTATGVAAALVTAVLAVTVAGQVDDSTDSKAQARSADMERNSPDAASRSDDRPTPKGAVPTPVTYDQKMDAKYPLAEKAHGSGEFATVGGNDPAPGKGERLRYRVDVEKGLPLDGELFAAAVQKTLNDDRSWGHGGTRTFERVSSGHADFVITLATPGTTAAWCAKSGLDTTEDNVSCDSAATDRVMINAYRWAQGAQTYGDKMHMYRQMLINHEVGHRLGHDHESCPRQGALAPVMMQQTKFLNTGDLVCRPNPWPFPGPSDQ